MDEFFALLQRSNLPDRYRSVPQLSSLACKPTGCGCAIAPAAPQFVKIFDEVTMIDMANAEATYKKLPAAQLQLALLVICPGKIHQSQVCD